MDDLRILLNVGLAMLLGGVIGLERETAQKPAGFRTHMLVSGAAALLVALSLLLVDVFDAARTSGALEADPIRVIQAVIVGISFLGAGTIFRSKGGDVHGLTTAASLLMSSGIGIAVAVQRTALAVALTVLVFVVLRVLGAVEARMQRR